MTVLKNIKFQKLGKFGEYVFIASSKQDQGNFDTLKELASKIELKEYGTFSPLYCNQQYDYCTIRFQKNNKHTFDESSKYDIEFVMKTKNKDGKEYVNCYIQKSKFISKPEPYDEGEILEF
jgi:hypothetical protein